MFDQPDHLTFTLPTWIPKFIGGREHFATQEERMALVVEAARQNLIQATGGPFAAAVFEADNGKLVSLGVNRVTVQNLSVLHAEVVALSLAQRKLNQFDLGAEGLPRHELVSSTEPCAMCLGAIPWSGVVRLVTGARDEDARRLGFDEGAKVADWKTALEERGIAVTSDVSRDRARAVLNEYGARGGPIYNSRAGD